MNVGLLPTTIKPSLKGFERLIQFPASTEHGPTLPVHTPFLYHLQSSELRRNVAGYADGQ